MRIMVSQMNGVQEPSVIEKTQAWSAMRRRSLCHCWTVRMYFPELARKREKIQKKSTRRSTDRRLGQTDLLNNSVENEKNWLKTLVVLHNADQAANKDESAEGIKLYKNSSKESQKRKKQYSVSELPVWLQKG